MALPGDFHVKYKVVRQFGCKNQRRSLRRQHKIRLICAKYLLRINCPQRGRHCSMHRRQRNHQNRFRIAKRRWIIEPQVQVIFSRQCQRRNVLEQRRMSCAQNAHHIDHSSNVRTVIPASRSGGGAELRKQVRRSAGGQRGHHTLAVLIVEHHLVGILRETRNLLGGRFIKALLVQLHVQASRQQRGASFKFLRIRRRCLADRVQVSFQPRSIKAELLQILRGTYESAGFAANRCPQRGKCSASFGREQDDGLLGIGRYGNKDSFFMNSLRPNFSTREPGFRRWVSSPSQKHHHHQIVDGLRVRHIGMHPEPVSRLQVWHFCNWDGHASPLHVYLKFRPDQIKRRVVGASCQREKEHCRKTQTRHNMAKIGP